MYCSAELYTQASTLPRAADLLPTPVKAPTFALSVSELLPKTQHAWEDKFGNVQCVLQ